VHHLYLLVRKLSHCITSYLTLWSFVCTTVQQLGALVISAMLVTAGFGIGCHAYEALVPALQTIDLPSLVCALQ
jgi:hypothetical protein